MTTKTIKLKKIDNKQYYLSGLPSQYVETVIEAIEEKRLKELNIPILDIDFKNVTKFGEKNERKTGGLSTYVEYLKGYEPTVMGRRKVQFRDYSRPEEQQLKNAHLVSICEDAVSSVRILLKTIPNKYIALWYKEV